MPDISQSTLDGFMLINDVKGEAQTARVGLEGRGWIDVSSVSFGVGCDVMPDVDDEGNARLIGGTVTAGTVTVKADLHAGSPRLFEFCTTKKPIPNIQIWLYKAGGNKAVRYLEVILKNCMISSYKIEAGSDSYPDETLEIEYSTITMIYTPQGDDGAALPAVRGSYSRPLDEEAGPPPAADEEST